MKSLVSLIFSAAWITGIVLAEGFWRTLLAVLVAPYGWYLIAKALLVHFGALS